MGGGAGSSNLSVRVPLWSFGWFLLSWAVDVGTDPKSGSESARAPKENYQNIQEEKEILIAISI